MFTDVIVFLMNLNEFIEGAIVHMVESIILLILVFIMSLILSTTGRFTVHILSMHGGRVSNALACNARGDGFAPPICGGISEIQFSNRYSLRHGGS